MLDHLAEFDLQPPRQGNIVVPLEYVSDAAFAGLTVDTNHFLVPAADIERIDGQIGHVPGIALFPTRETFANGVLVAAGESGKDQLTGIGMTRMSGNFGARLHHFGDFGHAGQIQSRVNPLGIQVHGHGDQVHVTGALAVAHQGTFHPICPGHHAEFGSGHRAAPVIVGM